MGLDSLSLAVIQSYWYRDSLGFPPVNPFPHGDQHGLPSSYKRYHSLDRTILIAIQIQKLIIYPVTFPSSFKGFSSYGDYWLIKFD
jgi:hypothetical protein